MTRERVVIAIVAFGILLTVLYVDYRFETHLGSLLLIAALGTLALSELYVLFRRVGLDSYPAFGVMCAAVLFLWRGIGQALGIPADAVKESVAGLLAAVVAMPLLAVIFRSSLRPAGGREQFERSAVTLYGLLLVWFLFSFVLEIRLLDDGTGTTHLGLKLAMVLVLSVKVGDSVAYVVGRSFGVTPLTWVSPKKTWEGAASSVVGAVVVALLLGMPLLRDWEPLRWWHMLVFGVLTNVAGQFGDLLESLVKRRSGAKDSGNFLREMGGFLDLIDSLILAAPVGYLFVRLVVL